MITASWSLQRAHHGEQPYWAVVLLASALGQIGLPGGGFGFGYGSGAGIGDAPAGVRRAGDGGHQQPDQRHDPGGAHLRLPAASRRALRLQRQARHLSRHPAGLLGGRQSVPPSSGHQQAAPRLAAAGDHRRARAVVDRDRAPCRYRAAGDHVAGAKRHRRRAARQLRHGHAAGDRAGRRGAQRLRDLQRARAAARLCRRPTRKAATRWRGCGISTSNAATAPAPTPRRCRISIRSGSRAIWKFRRRAKSTSCSAISAPIPKSTSSARRPAGSSSIRKRSRASATTIARRIRPGSSRGNGSAARPPRPIRCISSRASRATGCTARWIAGRSAPAARSPAARRSTINPADAKARGIRDGDVVRVHNSRGACLAGAVVSDTVSAGVVQLSCGAWYDPADDGDNALCRHGNAERADARPGHLEARAGAELGDRAGRGRALDRAARAGARLRAAAASPRVDTACGLGTRFPAARPPS